MKGKRYKKRSLKINGDTMTTIVVSSLLFCVAVVVAGFVLAWRGVDASAIVSSALLLFGTELGVCGVMKIFDRNNEAQDRRVEESRQRAAERKKKEAKKDMEIEKDYEERVKGNG